MALDALELGTSFWKNERMLTCLHQTIYKTGIFKNLFTVLAGDGRSNVEELAFLEICFVVLLDTCPAALAGRSGLFSLLYIKMDTFLDF